MNALIRWMPVPPRAVSDISSMISIYIDTAITSACRTRLTSFLLLLVRVAEQLQVIFHRASHSSMGLSIRPYSNNMSANFHWYWRRLYYHVAEASRFRFWVTIRPSTLYYAKYLPRFQPFRITDDKILRFLEAAHWLTVFQWVDKILHWFFFHLISFNAKITLHCHYISAHRSILLKILTQAACERWIVMIHYYSLR